MERSTLINNLQQFELKSPLRPAQFDKSISTKAGMIRKKKEDVAEFYCHMWK